MDLILLLTLAPLAALAVGGLRRVPEGTACTVHRFGRYARTLSPGLRWTIPFVDHIAHRVHLVGHQVAVPHAADASLPTRGAVYYQILEPQRVGGALDMVDALVQREAGDGLSALLARAAADDADTLSAQLKAELNQRLADLGLRVTRCKLDPARAA